MFADKPDLFILVNVYSIYLCMYVFDKDFIWQAVNYMRLKELIY